MNETNNTPEDDKPESSLSNTINKLFGHEAYENSVRKQYSNALNKKGLDIPSDEEREITKQQFIEYATLQMLRFIAIKYNGKYANKFMYNLVDQFLDIKKTSAVMKLEIDSIEQKDSPIEQLVSEELMEKERKIVHDRITNLYDTFEKDIKSLLKISNDDIDEISDDESDDIY